MGVGYEATDLALKEQYGFQMLVTLAVLKIVLTALCLGAGFGGGVFSPSLFIGAMVGGAFGIVAGYPFPELSSGHRRLHDDRHGCRRGRGAGAPISTILMIFELTNDYRLTIAGDGGGGHRLADHPDLARPLASSPTSLSAAASTCRAATTWRRCAA